jgi:hypothetical protein
MRVQRTLGRNVPLFDPARAHLKSIYIMGFATPFCTKVDTHNKQGKILSKPKRKI